MVDFTPQWISYGFSYGFRLFPTRWCPHSYKLVYKPWQVYIYIYLYIYIIICMYEGLWGITLYEFPMISLLYHHIFIWPRLPEVELHFLGGSQLLTLLLSLGASSAIAWGGDPERRGVKDDPQGIGWWLHGDFMGVHGKQLLGKPGDKSSRLVNCP